MTTRMSPASVRAESMRSIRETTREQIEPMLQLHAELSAQLAPEIDVAVARSRVRNGRVAFDAWSLISSANGLLPAFIRATAALERSGLATNEEAVAARERTIQLSSMFTSWMSGEPDSQDRVRVVARKATALVGSALLGRASREVKDGVSFAAWRRPECPCCGSAPDITHVRRNARILVCSRCDASWRTKADGCIGCGTQSAPSFQRIRIEAIDYALRVCHGCGRYIKEPQGVSEIVPLVERALTDNLDTAARSRGLRL